jgi:hypothetical protein
MKKLLFFSLFFVLSIFVFPQDKNYKTTALSFSFNGLNLSSYYGGVGGRFWTTDSTVFNVSIGGSYSQKVYEATENLKEGFEKNSSLTFGIGGEIHYPTSENLSPYLSFRGSYTMNSRYYRPGYYDYESKDRINSFSFDFGLGVEYWILERISLSGQHLFNLHLDNGERTVGGVENETQDISGFGAGIGTTSIMLSIYF